MEKCCQATDHSEAIPENEDSLGEEPGKENAEGNSLGEEEGKENEEETTEC